MKKKILALILICAVLLSASGCMGEKKYSSAIYDVFDTDITVTAYCKNEKSFDAMSRMAFAEFRRLGGLFDIYNSFEEPNLYALNQSAGKGSIALDRSVIELLVFCKEIYALTDGRVNIAMGSVLSLWHTARDNKALPNSSDLKAAALHCDIEDLIIDEQNNTAELLDPLMLLDVGAVAKGYGTELVRQKLLDAGYTDFVIAAGGNVATAGSAPKGKPWQVGIQSPLENGGLVATVESSGTSVVTSGGYARFAEIDGKLYHHIIDPQTLMPAEKMKSATVICQSSALADGLSTALFLMEPQDAVAFADAQNARVIIVQNDGTVLDSAGK